MISDTTVEKKLEVISNKLKNKPWFHVISSQLIYGLIRIQRGKLLTFLSIAIKTLFVFDWKVSITHYNKIISFRHFLRRDVKLNILSSSDTRSFRLLIIDKKSCLAEL